MTGYNVVCRICGTAFVAALPHTKYCSEECRDERPITLRAFARIRTASGQVWEDADDGTCHLMAVHPRGILLRAETFARLQRIQDPQFQQQVIETP